MMMALVCGGTLNSSAANLRTAVNGASSGTLNLHHKRQRTKDKGHETALSFLQLMAPAFPCRGSSSKVFGNAVVRFKIVQGLGNSISTLSRVSYKKDHGACVPCSAMRTHQHPSRLQVIRGNPAPLPVMTEIVASHMNSSPRLFTRTSIDRCIHDYSEMLL